jgi:glycosyltransferase involved in cell wall biosynthesis
MSKKPKITIITVTLNAEDCIESAINSVLIQDYENLEYIIIDGLSSDSTVRIIKRYESSIDYWISERDSGLYEAMNKAIEVMTGEYYMVMGADDILFPGVIKKLVDECIVNKNIDFLVTSVWMGDYKLRSGIRPQLGYLGAHFMVNAHSLGMLIRKNIHKEVGMYSTQYEISADALFIKKIFNSDAIYVSTDIISGRFSIDGKSNLNLAQGLCENFLIQLKTEKKKKIQLIIFILRLIKNFFKL